jgi:hypothetical protein
MTRSSRGQKRQFCVRQKQNGARNITNDARNLPIDAHKSEIARIILLFVSAKR